MPFAADGVVVPETLLIILVFCIYVYDLVNDFREESEFVGVASKFRFPKLD
jgi:hypothetical protein